MDNICFTYLRLPTLILLFLLSSEAHGQCIIGSSLYLQYRMGSRDTSYRESVPVVASDTTDSDRPLLAVKTNLLMNMISAINVEAEVPIGNRWSIAGEWIFPWWLWTDRQRCFQLLSGNLEGKYWFGDRGSRDVMTGWFVGLYAGAGLYDLEWDKTGYQGEFYIAAGLSGGYSHTISRRGNLRLEYSLGVGYLNTDYRKYKAEYCVYDHWHLNHKSSGRYTWVGPTKAKVSLVWMLSRKIIGGLK